MRIPWISRDSHLEMMGILTAQITELTAERKVLLDRLGTLGLGGPLFSVPSATEAVADDEIETDVDAAAAELEQLLRLRRRPSQLAEALTRKAHRDAHKPPTSPRVSWVNAELDQAEAAGKMA